MNPIEKKIREAGGIVLSEPLHVGDSDEINPKCADQLFAALEHGWSRCDVCQKQYLNNNKPTGCTWAGCPFT